MSIPIRDISNVPITPRKRKGSEKIASDSHKRMNLGLLTPSTTPTKEDFIDTWKPVSTTSTTSSSNSSSSNNNISSDNNDCNNNVNDKCVKKLFGGSIYSQAKELFKRGNGNVSDSHVLVGRQQEAEDLQSFIVGNIENRTNDSLYISGPPGTGKTAQILKLIKYHQQQYLNKVKFININCMIVDNPESIFHEIICQIQNKIMLTGSGNKKFSIFDLTRYLMEIDEFNHLVIILDELDHLITKDQQILFELFNLITNKNLKTKLIIIGISNALDLTDKFLPRLKRNGISPKKISFLPYNSQQIKQVIQSKLSKLSQPIFHPMAIELCSKKAASITGDLRKAFDICYKALELIEQESKSKNNCNSPFTHQKVMISHIAKICSNAFGNDSLSRLSNLNLLQKVVLCCLYKTNQDLNVDQFYEFYKNIVLQKSDNLISLLKRGEFLEIISALESLAVISLSISKSKTKSQDFSCKIVTINIPKDDLLKSIGNIGLLNKIIFN